MNIFNGLFEIINVPLSYILGFFSDIFGNSFAAAVFVFTVFINAIFIPLSIKSQKASVNQMRIKPKLDELKKKYGDDKQRYSQEMQKLYQEENISMSGGCLPLLIRMPIMFSIYYLVTKPITYLMKAVPTDKIDAVWNNVFKPLNEQHGKKFEIVAENLKELEIIKWIQGKGSSEVIDTSVVVSKIQTEMGGAYDTLIEGINSINFNLFGIDLTLTPRDYLSWNLVEIFQNWNPVLLIPVFAFAAQMITSFLSMQMQKKINPDAPNMAFMMLSMPLISLFIGFSVPAGVGFYWICSSVIAGGIQLGLQYFYGPHKMLATERAKEIVAVYNEEQKFITKRVSDDGAEKKAKKKSGK